MCTAATYKTKDFYFGRTLDYEFSYGDQIVITPRNYSFHFRHVGDMKNHYAIIGMALDAYSRGMGGLGLPGDLSSSSRFVRVAFTKVNAISGESEEESVSQFFHILGSVDQQRGCCEVTDGKYEITLYTSCCNVIKGIYYYNTYENHQISAVDMHAEDLESNKLICYPVIQGERINYQNK